MVGPSGRTTVTEPYGPFTGAGLGEIRAGIGAELDLDNLPDPHVPPRQRRRREHRQRRHRCGSAAPTLSTWDTDSAPPF